MRSRRRRLRGRFQRARDARLRDGNVGGPRGPARGSLQKSASWSARTRARKFDLRAAPHAARGRSPTHGPFKKGRLVRADQSTENRPAGGTTRGPWAKSDARALQKRAAWSARTSEQEI